VSEGAKRMLKPRRESKCRREGREAMERHVNGQEKEQKERRRMVVKCKKLPEVFSVVVECRDEAEQREMFERMKEEGRRVRLLVL
jgi:hypothetical protein